MQIKTAIVEDIKDIADGNVFAVRVVNEKKADSSPPLFVNYASPYWVTPSPNDRTPSFAGLFAPPEPGEKVIIIQPEDSDQWFYMGTVASPVDTALARNVGLKLQGSKGKAFSNDPLDTKKVSNEPQAIGIQSRHGHNLKMSEVGNEAVHEFFTSLVSMVGKMLVMSDSEDTMFLKNQHNDGLKINGDTPKPDTIGPQGAQLKTKGNLFLRSDEGAMGFSVGEGGDTIEISNTAKPRDGDSLNKGSIDIESSHNDIKLKVYNPAGKRIFIDASQAEGLVQIRAGTEGVEVFTEGNVDFNCAGDFNVNAGGNVNLKGENVHLNPNFSFGKTTPTQNNEELENG